MNLCKLSIKTNKLVSRCCLRYYSSKELVKSSKVIRQQFLDFFINEHDHKFVKSSPVVPYHDPTLAFVNAGMNQARLKELCNIFRLFIDTIFSSRIFCPEIKLVLSKEWQTRKSAFELEENTMTFQLLGMIVITTHSLKCWAIGRLETTLR